MPELPEVEALVIFLREKLADRAIASIDVASISVLKTYDPPPTALAGMFVSGVTRRGKFLDIDVDGVHIITHLSRAGWLRWRDSLTTTPLKPGKGPISFRVHLDDGSGFDLTEAGTQKKLAVYIVDDPQSVPGIARLGPDPLGEEFDIACLSRGPCCTRAHSTQGSVARPVGDCGRWQCVQRRDLARCQALAVQSSWNAGRRDERTALPRNGGHACATQQRVLPACQRLS